MLTRGHLAPGDDETSQFSDSLMGNGDREHQIVRQDVTGEYLP
jgi:hypothetical protein